MSLCISTGWCAHKSGHNNASRSRLQNDELWMAQFWTPGVLKQVKPDRLVYYMSNCDISAKELYGVENAEFIYAARPAVELSYRHDWASSITMGAAYAYENGMDMLYIEQDCMVKNIPAVLEFAQDKPICFGYGEWSMYPGWAECSLVWVRHNFLPTFIYRLMDSGFALLDGNSQKPEQLWMDLFGLNCTVWPFGYGRKRPIDFTKPVFYAQQLTDSEIVSFQRAIHELP